MSDFDHERAVRNTALAQELLSFLKDRANSHESANALLLALANIVVHASNPDDPMDTILDNVCDGLRRQAALIKADKNQGEG